MTPTLRASARAHAFALLLALLSSGAAAAQESTQDAQTAAHTVTIKTMQFQPGELTVSAGQTVTWTNQDIVPHRVSADDGSFRSGIIEPGKSWSYTAKKAGRFPYTCTPHPNMHGALVVK